MHRLPEPLQAVIDQLTRLPGMGPKSAFRCALTLLRWPEAETRRLAGALHDLRDKLHLCSRCGAFADSDPCPICSDPAREEDALCITADWDSMLTLEQGGFFQGRYFILGGLLAPLDNVHPDSLEIQRLDARLGEGQVQEIILALGATVEAENTASYISGRVRSRYPMMRVSRLAQGIPLGAEVKFMDKETLRQSLKYRQEV